MASYRKRGSSWCAQVVRKVDGKRITKTGSFSTKAEAVAWANKTELALSDGKAGRIPDKTFGDLLEKYRDEVSITKRGEKWERARIGLLLRDELTKVNLQVLKAGHFAAWRDRRLKSVSVGSVRREWNLLSSACNIAWKEWHWLDGNPLKEVKRPAAPPSRDRRPTEDEVTRMLYACGDDYGTMTGRVGVAILFAIETGMRAGEIVGLQWPDVYERYVQVGIGKTQAATRQVPLSSEAVRLLGLLPRDEDKPVFQITSESLDALFRKAKSRALIEDLHFHDLRHEAITRLSRKLDVLALAKVVGHRDLKMLQVYYNPTADELANLLD